MIERVIVLGGGTAGLLAALSLKKRLPALHVRVLRSRELGVIGVGEGTTVGLPTYLHGMLGLDPAELFRRVNPTWKLGIRFVRWGPRELFHYSFAPTMQVRWNQLPKLAGYYCWEDMEGAGFVPALMQSDLAFLRNADGTPQMERNYGYHLENRQFVEYLEACAMECGISLEDEKVVNVRRGQSGVEGLDLETGTKAAADLYIDSSGFASVLMGRTLEEPYRSYRSTLFCDRAVAGGWDRTDEVIKPYTTVETMRAGWCWQIEHEHRINRGYVYSSDFIDDEAAELEFRELCPKAGPTRVVRFRTGRYERAWVDNVVAVGNACGFVEPLEATALAVIVGECGALVDALDACGCRPTPSQIRCYNLQVASGWECIRRFLGLHYRYNTRLETEFWRACREDTDLAGAEAIVDFYRENGPTDNARQSLLDPFDPFTMDGWLTLLVGMKVPHERLYEASGDEEAQWRQIKRVIGERAKRGVSVKEALELVRLPGWRWNPQFFTK